MKLESSAFKNGEEIPRKFTADGENVSPEFSWADAPEGTNAFALIIHDPDAPRQNGFTHWLLYDIPPTVNKIQENLPKQATASDMGQQGENDGGQLGYTGPNPPSGKHHYHVRLYALKETLGLPLGATAAEVQQALEGKVLEEAELIGTYEKQKAEKKSA